MAINISSDGDDDEVISAINTTPLVDIMLVLFIIFLITSPVVLQTLKVKLPDEKNVVTITKPENIVISIGKDGDIYWDMQLISDTDVLFEKMKTAAVKIPQPEIHIRGDGDARYESVGRVIYTAQRASILKVGFITQAPPLNQ